MKNVLILFILLICATGTFAQKPKTTAAKKTSTPKPLAVADEKSRLEAALAIKDAGERVMALSKFISDFPQSKSILRARENLAASRAAFGDERLQAQDIAGGVELFRLAVEQAPAPIPDRLFSEIISKLPANLFWRGQHAEALELATLIEKHVETNANQLSQLAVFYLGIENGTAARRLGEMAIVVDPSSSTAYQTLGIAARLDFEIDTAANAYAKALELDPTSIAAKRSLAEMRRALGQAEQAKDLFREVLDADPTDAAAANGWILALFESGLKAEGEKELAYALRNNPNNVSLLAAVAFWYAVNNEADKSIEYGRQSVQAEPRFVWGHIALARGLMLQNKNIEAEAALIGAKKYGDFPTIDFEIALARYNAGLYRDAIDELKKKFTFVGGVAETRLGGRILRKGKAMSEIIADERKASILTAIGPDDNEASAKLLQMMELDQKLATDGTAVNEIAPLIDNFVAGNDNMKIHRQLFAATLLLQKRIDTTKALELAKAAVAGAQSGLDVANPAAAIMANELYESRATAFTRGEFIIMPEVPRQTLSAILRGRIEEVTGWALYESANFPDSVVRFRRAVSVYPKDSSWWRSGTWRLGLALQANGAEKEALDTLISSYKIDKPEVGKYIRIEDLYKKLNGNTDGLVDKIGENPLKAFAQTPPTAAPETSKEEPAASDANAATNTTEVPAENTEKAAEVVATEKQQPTAEPVKNEVEAQPEPAKATPSGFAPIIITVPKVQSSSTKVVELKPTPEATPAPSGETPENPADMSGDNVASGGARQRVVPGKDVTSACSLTLSQDSISLLNDGGSVGILVGVDGDAGEIKDLIVTSENPNDIEIKLEPNLGGINSKRFYIIKSISKTTGNFVISFENGCGRKDVSVTVR